MDCSQPEGERYPITHFSAGSPRRYRFSLERGAIGRAEEHTTRKPMLSFLKSGLFQRRRAERHSGGGEFQEPPRDTTGKSRASLLVGSLEYCGADLVIRPKTPGRAARLENAILSPQLQPYD